tara:strand:- start:13164 stop:13877 length:714 start_codon:yes stop_codon:yes gene_type:complete
MNIRKFNILLLTLLSFFVLSCSATRDFERAELTRVSRSFFGLYKLTINSEGQPQAGSVASGALIYKDDKNSWILTAGHFCIDDENLTPENPIPKVTSGEIILSNIRGEETVGHVAIVARKFDACIIKAELTEDDPLILSEAPPKWGEKIFYTGAPMGFHMKNILLLYEGRYSGEDIQNAIYAVPATFGASGSPIVNKYGQLIGMVYAVHGGFPHITLSLTHSQLKEVLKVTKYLSSR